MTLILTLGQLTDLHLGPLPPFGLRHWNLKRGLGVLNWHRKRQTLHTSAALQLVLDDLLRHTPDHVAVTGDLINVGLPSEYESALAWLRGLGEPDRITVVPGNHDIYTRLGRREPGVERWRAYMSSSPGDIVAGLGVVNGFPFLRRRGAIALIGVNSAVPTPPGIATGRVGPDQLAGLHALLRATGGAGLFRCLMIHHPPLPGQAPPSRALKDASELAEVLRAAGVELVIHGHNHLDTLVRLPTCDGEALIVGIGSSSQARAHGPEPAARSALYRISERAGGWSLEIERRGLDATGVRVQEIERTEARFERAARHRA